MIEKSVISIVASAATFRVMRGEKYEILIFTQNLLRKNFKLLS